MTVADFYGRNKCR